MELRDMAKIVFDDYEQECVHFLAERFNQGGDRVSVREFPRCNEVGEEKVQRVIARFCNYGWLECPSFA